MMHRDLLQSHSSPLPPPPLPRPKVAVEADQEAAALEATRREEQELLEQIRVAFEAKSVVRVCALYDRGKVLTGARKLLENAEVIKASVSLAGASIAIDDCYEVWGSGFISIPYNFTVQELPSQLTRLLHAGDQSATDGGEGMGGGWAPAQRGEGVPGASRQVVASTGRAQLPLARPAPRHMAGPRLRSSLRPAPLKCAAPRVAASRSAVGMLVV
jgi:hypothetical protein